MPFVVVITALIMIVMNLTDSEEVYKYDIEHIQNSSSSKGKIFNLLMLYIDKKFGRYGVTGFYAIFFILFLPFAFNWSLILQNWKNWRKSNS